MAPSLWRGGYGPELAAAERARQQLSVAGVVLGDASASALQICNPATRDGRTGAATPILLVPYCR